MSTTDQLRNRLLKKLLELFQLNQPDLDFGFYRIMHAKAREVHQFIDKDLLNIVDEAFEGSKSVSLLSLQAEIDEAIEQAKRYGAPDPENTPAVKELQNKLEAIKGNASSEADVYDHLYRFFERYYDDGDFISRRYYTRETPGKAAPFAIPYNGEEVKLHWANADQYYIKSTEYFSSFTFDLTQSREIREMSAEERVLNQIPESPLNVHFRVVEASEGEHGNVKASDTQKRFFIIHQDQPVEISEIGELIINFEYRSDPEKSGQEGSWRDKRNAEAVETIFEALKSIADAETIPDSSLPHYSRLLKVPAPTEKDRTRPVLAKYLNQYTARNTMDYFIHKDLGSFLRRELDFYIKNEVMRLDDIENADAPAVESYLAKIKVLRTIAGKLIDFLAQLEDFQKKLWLKKKFVVETNYCITLDRVPEELYPEIATNEAQIEEWVTLFAINEIEGDLVSPGYCDPLTVEFLKANNKLVLDTRFFDEAFKDLLLTSIDDFDDQCDGLLIHSENFQALNLLQERYREQVKCVYIDPPYNTSASEIVYKNSYKNSSWLSLIKDRVLLAKSLVSKSGISCTTIDDFEFHSLRNLLNEIYERDNFLGVVTIKNNPSGRSTTKGFSIAHEYAIFYGISNNSIIGRLTHSEKQKSRYDHSDKKGPYEWVNFRRHGGANALRRAQPKAHYPIFVSEDSFRLPEMEWDNKSKAWILKENPQNGETVIYPIAPNSEERVWKWEVKTVLENPDEFCVKRDMQGQLCVYRKARLNKEGTLPLTTWDDSKYSATSNGTNLLKNIFGTFSDFAFPKSIFAVQDCLLVSNSEKISLILDYFAGSGTTGHAVINLNREDGGKRKYVLVEMGDYFDTVLKPRIAKVVYSENWKDGKPVVARPSRSGPERDALATTIKYIRLESYEDTLKNLQFDENPIRKKAIEANSSLKEDYMLHYLLDVETRGSQSLLNIDAFADPISYKLEIKKPGTDEYVTRNVDLIETFNYLIGLRVTHIAAPQEITAEFMRIEDPEVPRDQKTKLVVVARASRSGPDRDGLATLSEPAAFWFRKIEGWVPKDPSNPNNQQKEKVLVVWRRLTGDLEKDNLMLDEWFEKNRISTRDFEFNLIYVNGSNNLPNLKRDGETWKVTLIEEEFMKRMWDVEGI